MIEYTKKYANKRKKDALPSQKEKCITIELYEWELFPCIKLISTNL